MDLIVFFMWVMGAMLIILAMGIGFYVWWSRVFRYKIEVFEGHGGGHFKRVAIYRARKLRRGKAQNEILWVPKVKKYCSAYGRKMGKDLYWYAEGQDGYWYNILLGDIDAKMGLLDIEPVDKDVKAFYVSNDNEIDLMYQKPKNWPMILMTFSIILALIIVFSGGYFMYSKQQEILGSVASSQIVSQENLQSVANIMASVDNLNLDALAESLEQVAITLKELKEIEFNQTR